MTDQTIDYETGEILPPSTDPKALAGLFAKLARAMGKIGRLPKSGHNSHFNYDFVTDSDVSDPVRAALADEGVAFFASMVRAQADGKKTIADFVYTFADGETGATWSCNWTGEAIDSQDKGTAKAATSALKYFLLKNFILSSGDQADDTDADAARPKAQSKRTPTKSKASGNGQKPRNEPTPSPTALLTEVDAAIDGSYGNVPDLLVGIQAELGDGWKWPTANDTEGWKEAKEAAIKHAEVA